MNSIIESLAGPVNPIWPNAVACSWCMPNGFSNLTQAPSSSPGRGPIKGTVCGDPDEKNVSTNFVERQNLTMRMSIHRFTRLTNGFSKKVENHACAVALHYMHYNFCRIHKTLRVTPAMAAGVTDHVWTMEDIAVLLEAAEAGRNQERRDQWQTWITLMNGLGGVLIGVISLLKKSSGVREEVK